MRYGIGEIRTAGNDIIVCVEITLDKSELSKLLNIQQLITGYPYPGKPVKVERKDRRKGSKLKDMSIEEKRAYRREVNARYRKRLLDEKQDLTPTGKKVMKGLQRNADTLKKIKEDFPNAIPERP